MRPTQPSLSATWTTRSESKLQPDQGSVVPGWVAPSVGLLAACIVAFANFIVQRWRYRIDQIATATDLVCQDVIAAGDRATRYWQLDASQAQNRTSVAELEAQLLGFQMRLQQGIIGLREQDKRLDLSGAELLLTNFFDRLTGGDFQVADRSVDFARSREVQAEAARLCAALRRALGRRSRRWW